MNNTMQTRRSFVRSAGALGASALLSACSGNAQAGSISAASEPAAASEAEGLTKLPFCIVAADANKAGVYIAMDQGFYAEEGIELEIVQPQDDYGDVTIGTGVTPLGFEFQEYIGAARGQERPLPLVALATAVEHQATGVLALASSGITRPRDLEGKRYGSWGTPIENAIIQKMIEFDGGDPAKLEIVPLTTSDVLMGLQADLFDAAWSWYNIDLPNAELLGVEVATLPISGSDPVLDFYTPVIAGNEQWVAENPELTRRFLRATKRGYELANEDADAVAAVLLAHGEMTEELAHGEAKYMHGNYFSAGTSWGHIDDARWSDFFEWLNDNDLTEVPLDPHEGYTMEYLEG